MLNGEPIGYASRTLLLEAGRMVGRRNRSRSTRNRPVTGECITTGQGLGASWFELWLSCCSMIPRSPRSKRTVAEQLASDRCYEKAGFEARYRNHPRWSSRVHGSNTPGIRANTQCCLTLPSRGDVQGLAPLCTLMSNVKHHEEAVIAVSTQLSEVVGVIERHLEPTLLAYICTAPQWMAA